MIQLRQIIDESGKLLKIQQRSLNVELGWIDEKCVFTLKPPVKISMEKNWGAWEDLHIFHHETAKPKGLIKRTVQKKRPNREILQITRQIGAISKTGRAVLALNILAVGFFAGMAFSDIFLGC